MDLLAKGESLNAVDVVAQRIKAMEVSIVENGWEKAQFLELIEAPQATLLTKEDEELMHKERELKRKFREKPDEGTKRLQLLSLLASARRRLQGPTLRQGPEGERKRKGEGQKQGQ